jgi:hypothetical protein
MGAVNSAPQLERDPFSCNLVVSEAATLVGGSSITIDPASESPTKPQVTDAASESTVEMNSLHDVVPATRVLHHMMNTIRRKCVLPAYL